MDFSEEIYLDLNEPDSLSTDSLIPDKPAKWGEYDAKPISQDTFEKMVRATVAELTEHEENLAKLDVRPFVKDQGSGQWCLIDTGSAATIVPRRSCDLDRKVDNNLTLKAVNGTTVQTYGRREMKFMFNGAEFKYSAIVSDLPYTIVGWDMLTFHRLDLIWRGKKCVLKGPKVTIPVELHSGSNLHVAEVQFFETYQKWSQQENQKHAPDTSKIPTAYQNILASFPNITKVDFTKTPAHNIVHEIDTGNHKPCRSRPRPLMPNSPRAIKGEAA